MGNKVNLAIQNQYVEFAKKDGEGKDIAESIEALQEAIAGKIGFDMDIECGHGPYAIPANTFNDSLGTSNVPCIVRLKATGSSKPFGVALVTPSVQNYNIIYMFQGNIYKKSGLSYGSSYTLGNDDDVLLKGVIKYDDTNDVYLTRDLHVGRNLAVAGNITGGSIIENMSGYTYGDGSNPDSELTKTMQYVSIVKNGNKLTICLSGTITRLDTITAGGEVILIGSFTLPEAISSKLIPIQDSRVDMREVYFAQDYSTGVNLKGTITKTTNTFTARVYGGNNLTLNIPYCFRYEITFLLSDNMIS